MKKSILSYISCFLLLFLISFSVQAQDKGVIVLAHGGSEKWDQAIIEAAEPLKEKYEVEVAFGMANYVSMYNAVKTLEEQGIAEIAVVQLFISSYSPIIRQNEYLLGKRDSLADGPMPIMHHVEKYKKMMGIDTEANTHSAHSSGHRFFIPKNLQPIPTDADITITGPLDDHPVVADILHRRIMELSTDPSNETILLVAHGPNREEDNKKWINTMESLTKKIQQLQQQEGVPYKQIFSLTVRDDAPDAIFNQAKAHLRTLVRQAGQNGDVIVIPLYLSSGGREQAVAERLEGLEYKWSGKTLLPDPAISDFLLQSALKAFEVKN